MTPDEQIAAILKMASNSSAKWLVRLLVTTSLALGALGFWGWRPVYFMPIPLLAAVAYSANRVMPRVQDAARAITSGERVKGRVTLSIASWSGDDRYYAEVEEPSLGSWRFEFIPLGWTPSPGVHSGTLFRVPGVRWPALIQLDHGVLHPRDVPELRSPSRE